MIKQASRVNFHKLKLDNDPRSTRLIFMYFIEDLTNLLDMFHETYQILSNYPKVQEPKKKYMYAKKSLFTFVNSYANSEVKRIIKTTHGNGCQAILLLQARCARATPDDTIRLERNFNSTQLQPTENATKYIKRFRNARLLAKSVGIEVEEKTLIDKFLVSMGSDKRYSTTIRTFQLQRRNETLTENYNLAPLTMTEIEIQLYTIDENTQHTRHIAHQATSKTNMRSKSNVQRKNFQPRDLSTVRCYKCDNMGHYANKCPLKFAPKTQEQGNSAKSREIILQNTDTPQTHVNMVQISNVGRKQLKHVEIIPPAHDLLNWVMDSGATCHMTPYKIDFIPLSIKPVKKK